MQKKRFILLDYLFIILVGILVAFNYTLFIVPNDFAPAGFNGIATMLQYKLNFSIGYTYMLINIPLCILAFFLVDRKFAIRTFVYCMSYSSTYLFLQSAHWLIPFHYDAGGIDTVYPVLIAGIISGFAYGILVRRDSSTGGTDVIARYVTRRKPSLNFFWITSSLSATVAFASYFVYAKEGIDGKMIYDLKPVCLCALYCFVSSFVGNAIIKGSKAAYQFIVVTEHPEAIEAEITETFHHSATRLKASGVYTGKDKTMLLCVVNKHQMVDFENLIAKYPDTFAIEQQVGGVVGNFKRVK
ncbi:MAG: YitT family protein [Clostridia bacterium]|nr:YitT family protein [Clostridia bacterium]